MVSSEHKLVIAAPKSPFRIQISDYAFIDTASGEKKEIVRIIVRCLKSVVSFEMGA